MINGNNVNLDVFERGEIKYFFFNFLLIKKLGLNLTFEQFAKWGEIWRGAFSLLCTCSSTKIRSLLR